jgi:sigma-E factor negative regulatory protein RseB
MRPASTNGHRTGLRSLRLSSLTAVLLASGVAVWSSAGAQVPPEPPERTELQWLQAIQTAAQRLNYVGTIVYQRGAAVQSSRIVHYFDGSVSHERLQLLDGKQREYIRRDTEVQCLYPDSRKVRLERRPDQEAFPALGAGAPAEILERYRLELGGIERVAGLQCRVITLQPLDDLRYGHWLCADRRSALLLKAQTLNERAEPLEQMAFAEVKIGERMDRNQLKPSWSTEGWQVDRAETQPTDVEENGWRISAPAGFRRLRAVVRTMTSGDAEKPAMQVVYSDGLATMSVFIEPGKGTNLMHDITHFQGPISGYSRRVGDALVTAIGEVPPATVRTAALSVSPIVDPTSR